MPEYGSSGDNCLSRNGSHPQPHSRWNVPNGQRRNLALMVRESSAVLKLSESPSRSGWVREQYVELLWDSWWWFAMNCIALCDESKYSDQTCTIPSEGWWYRRNPPDLIGSVLPFVWNAFEQCHGCLLEFWSHIRELSILSFQLTTFEKALQEKVPTFKRFKIQVLRYPPSWTRKSGKIHTILSASVSY